MKVKNNRIQKLCPAVGRLMVLLLSFIIAGCASKPLPTVIYSRTIYPLDRYPIKAESAGIKVVAIPFSPGRDVYGDPAKPVGDKTGLPFNILETKVLPIRLVVINHTDDEMILDPDQITGVSNDVTYRSYSPPEAVALIAQSQAFKNAVKGSQIGPFVKSILGGDMIVEALKGGMGGLASGGVTGGATGAAKGATEISLEQAQGYEKALIQLINQEYVAQGLKRQTLLPGFIADGLIFLPGQAGITGLRILAYNVNQKKPVSLGLEIK